MKKLIYIFILTLSSCYSLENHVAEESIKEYEMIQRNNGTEMELYVRASLVAEAYLQAKDDDNYKKWKIIEVKHGKAAGLIIK